MSLCDENYVISFLRELREHVHGVIGQSFVVSVFMRESEWTTFSGTVGKFSIRVILPQSLIFVLYFVALMVIASAKVRSITKVSVLSAHKDPVLPPSSSPGH